MPATSILNQNNVQYADCHHTLKDMVDAHIPLNATTSVFYCDRSLDAGLRDRHRHLC